jgi:hypothetical protein
MPPERTACPSSGTHCNVTAALLFGATKGCDSYNGGVRFVAISPNVQKRCRQAHDLREIAAISDDAFVRDMAAGMHDRPAPANADVCFSSSHLTRLHAWIFCIAAQMSDGLLCSHRLAGRALDGRLSVCRSHGKATAAGRALAAAHHGRRLMSQWFLPLAVRHGERAYAGVGRVKSLPCAQRGASIISGGSRDRG